MFFSKDEIAELDALQRVASYEKFRPTGAAVNESNTAATLLGRGIDAISGKASKYIPLVSDISQAREAGKAQNLASVLASKSKPKGIPGAAYAMPAIYGSRIINGGNQ